MAIRRRFVSSSSPSIDVRRAHFRVCVSALTPSRVGVESEMAESASSLRGMCVKSHRSGAWRESTTDQRTA